MKKILKTLLAFAATSLLAFSCSNEISDSKAALLANFSSQKNDSTVSRAGADSTITIYLYGVPADNKNPGVWAWKKAASDEDYCTAGWPGNFAMTAGKYEGYAGYKYELTVDPAYNLGILFNNLTTGAGGTPKTDDIIIDKKEFTSDVILYFNWNSMAYYKSVDDCVGIMGGSITALNKDNGSATITCKTSLLSDGDITDLISVKDSAGNDFTVGSAVITSDELTISVTNNGSADVGMIPYTVTYSEKEKSVSISTELIETLYGKAASAVNDLGLTLSGSNATFKTWAPTASAASVLLYDTAANAYDSSLTEGFNAPGATTKDYKNKNYTPTEQTMSYDSSTGIWSVENVDVTGLKYYKYKLTIEGTDYYVADIWHGVATADSAASQIASIDAAAAKPADWEAVYTNPFGSSGSETKKYNDAVIYEMNIRDWSRAVDSSSTGKFTDIARPEIIEHLKDLGVTHVQILPMFDYAQLNSDKNYNWGYNPYHYNVPEGRYVTDDYTDGTQAVKEMRQMIKALHDNGIAVIMDVVYNHTSGDHAGSLYDSTVPGYFYHQDESGNYINYSGCGNAINTDHAMVRKYVKESLLHWMNDYHINGFRFDLMGIHSKAAMKEFYEALYAIDKNVLVYGEPWTGNGEYPTDGAKSAGKASSGYGFGAFDDDYRDAIKGGEFGGFGIGQIQGSFSENIETGLVGDVISKNNRNSTGVTGLALHYAECHDNFTLFDKLVYSTLSPLPSGDSYASKFAAAYEAVINDSSKLAVIKKQQMLAGAYVILAQGIPFLNGGQEFMRTKKGDPDSYSADKKGGITWTNEAGPYNIDDVNTIDLTMKTKYSDVYNTYKGLIALRKSNDAFTNPTSCTAVKLQDGITRYTVSKDSETYEVYFNASDSDFKPVYVSGETLGAGIKNVKAEKGVWGKVVSVENGNVSTADVATLQPVEAHSFLIIKK